MKIAIDLHIHSCLSPCADDDMTPNNILGMAALKELDAVAVADHNSALNLPACKAVADAYGVLLLPAIEVQTREEVHVLSYFPSVEAALDFSEHIRDDLFMPNDSNFFGEQCILDEDDNPIGKEKLLLAQSTNYSVDDLAEAVRAMGGVSVPAHINRQANSIIYTLGFIPPGLFNSVEVSRLAPPPAQDISNYHAIYSSDAHNLGDVLERDSFLEVEELSVAAILAYLDSPKAR